MRSVIAIAVAAGCGAAPVKPSAPPAAASRPAARDCHELARPLTQHMTESRPIEVTCEPGRFGAPGTFVFAEGRGDDGDERVYAAVRDDGAPLVEAYTDANRDMEVEPSPTFLVGDLDGDGVDEVVELHKTDRHFTGVHVIVMRVEHGAWEVEEGPWVSRDNSGEIDPPTTCAGEATLEDAGAQSRLVVTVTAAVDPQHDCLAVGRHVFALRGGKLEELP